MKKVQELKDKRKDKPQDPDDIDLEKIKKYAIDDFDKKTSWKFREMGSYDENYNWENKRKKKEKLVHFIKYERTEEDITYIFTIRFYSAKAMTHCHWSNETDLHFLYERGDSQELTIHGVWY